MLRFAISTIVLKVIKQLAGRIILSIDKCTIICIVDIMSHIFCIETPKNKDKNMLNEIVPVIVFYDASANAFKAFVAAKSMIN